MPLPVRSTSVRAPSTDTRLNVPRDTQKSHVRKLQPLRSPSTVTEDKDTENTELSVDGSEASSRIPSPFKRQTRTETATRPRAEIPRQTERATGHTRQRSTGLPATDGRPKISHSRSTSTVSTNTTTTSHTVQTANTASTSGSDRLRSGAAGPRVGTIPRPLGVSTRTKAESSLRSNNPLAISRSVYTSPYADSLQSELLQLAIVHDESSQGLRKYQASIEQSLNSNRAGLKSIRDDVTEKQQAFYHALNIEAVNVWLQQYGYQSTCQLVQNLSVAVRDLSNLEHIFGGEDGLAAIFQAWEKSMSAGKTADLSSNDDVRMHLEFDQHLGPELRRFKQQIVSVQRIFSNLPLSTSESALATVLKLHISLANILHQQSQIMLSTGQALVSAHNQWITSEINNAINDCINHGTQGPVASFLR